MPSRTLICSIAGAVSLCACASATPARVSPRSPVSAVAQVKAPASAEGAEAPPVRAPAPNRCLPDGRVALPPSPEVADAVTCSDDRRLEAGIAKKLKAKYRTTMDGSSVDVAFDCDPITSDVSEVAFETGAGHGGGLEVWRLYRDPPSDKDFHVLGLSYDEGYLAKGKDSRGLSIARGTISAASLEKALAGVRPALTAIVREIEPPPLPNGLRGMRGFGSSGDFHDFFRIRDDANHEIERSFTGYPSSSEQRLYLGLELADAAFSPLLQKIAFEPGKLTEVEQSWFVRQYLAAGPRLHREFAWWVRERYVALAGWAGTRALVPSLINELRADLTLYNAQASERSVAERRLDGVNLALSRITGWDIRLDENGEKRSTLDVAGEYLSECERGLLQQDR